MNNKINDIVELLRNLPGISLKIAERMAIQIIEKPELADIFVNIYNITKFLDKDDLTGLIVEKGMTPNDNKDKDILLVVDSNKDINNILKKTRTSKSIFVLGMENKRNFDIIKKVIDRLHKVVKEYQTKEILFLLTPSIESELIMRVVKEEMTNWELKPKLTRLSMGIPFGGSIEFSDERTIREAMKKREEA